MGYERNSNSKVRLGGMLAITQFEVYVLQKGRWILHARYPSEERKEAILDARTTEISTGYPSKVMRETYFPETNDTETITAYISPKAKSLKSSPAVPKATPLRTAANAFTRRRPRTARTPMSVSNVIFRVIVAGGISLTGATLIILIVNWLLRRMVSSGVQISSEMIGMVLTYSYVVVFLLFFFSLFRSRLPLHRLLADLWQKTASSKPGEAATAAAILKEQLRLKPKNARTSAEALREYEDMKVKRGDLDTTKPPESTEASTPEAAPPPAPVETPPVLEPQKAAEKAAAEKAAAKKAEEKKAEEKKAKEKPPQESPAIPAAVREETGFDKLTLERMVLRRFASDAVRPATAGTMRDDPVARRAAALVLAGAAAGVAATANLGPAAEIELLADAQRHLGLPDASVDLFMNQYAEQVTAPANTTLIAAGRGAMSAYLGGSDGVVAMLARALAAWRTPFGQPNPGMLGPAPMPPLPFDAPFESGPLVDIYLLTELREEHLAPAFDETAAASATAEEARHDQAMGRHNSVVRTALTAFGGHEVKHTGKGIFARFATARAAVDAAVDMTRQFASSSQSPKVAIGIVGNTIEGEDPILSPTLIHRAQAVAARARGGEILAEPQIHAAIIGHDAAPGDFQGPAPGLTEGIDLVRIVAEDNIDPEPGV